MSTLIKLSKLGMLVSLIMIGHALFYSNEHSLLIVIFGYILIIVSAIVYGLCIPINKPISTNLSEIDLNSIKSDNTYGRSCESIINKLIVNNIPPMLPRSIQAYNLSALLNKPIDIDQNIYEASYAKTDDKDYATQTTIQRIIKSNNLADEENYREDDNPMYQ